MTDQVDEAMIIAWIDGELTPEQAQHVARAVALDRELGALADTHRQIKARFSAAFGPLAEEPAALPPSASILSLDAARAARTARPARRSWAAPGAIAASLVVGLLIGQFAHPSGLSDQAEALALGAPLVQALDQQLSGEKAQVRISLSFRDREGAYCRTFTARQLQGIACRAGKSWQLRYGRPVTSTDGDYRMAGNDPAEAAVIENMIAGQPLDGQGEQAARAKGWRGR